MPNMPAHGSGPQGGLAKYWDRPVSELADVPAAKQAEADAERHRIYALLTLALVFGYWNGNKRGAVGDYPWRSGQKIGDNRYAGDQFGDRYVGHNIACIAVDENGEIIDFDFNHNELLNSSAEHAEARLIRRIFSLNQSYDHWQTLAAADLRDVKYGNTFNGVTIYTSLESCAQCSGVMTLASCRRVIYLQSDPGQNMIGNLLYNLTRPDDAEKAAILLQYTRPKPANRYWAPEPLPADAFGFDYKAALESAYDDYAAAVAAEPDRYFFKDAGGKEDRSTSITSFLCTDPARAIFQSAAKEFAGMTVVHETHQPVRSDGKSDGVLTNREVLAHARAFLAHAVTEARRGTPHR